MGIRPPLLEKWGNRSPSSPPRLTPLPASRFSDCSDYQETIIRYSSPPKQKLGGTHPHQDWRHWSSPVLCFFSSNSLKLLHVIDGLKNTFKVAKFVQVEHDLLLILSRELHQRYSCFIWADAKCSYDLFQEPSNLRKLLYRINASGSIDQDSKVHWFVTICKIQNTIYS